MPQKKEWDGGGKSNAFRFSSIVEFNMQKDTKACDI